MWISFVFEVVLGIIFGIIGLFGNYSLIRLFAKKETKLNFHKLMMTLSVYDTIYILLSMAVFSLPEISEDYKTQGYYFYIVPKALPMMQVALTGSVYFTVCISLERYLTVCHPFYIASKRWSVKRYIIPIATFSILYNAPRFFELTNTSNTSQYFELQNNSTRVNGINYPCCNGTLKVEESGLTCLNNSNISLPNIQLQNKSCATVNTNKELIKQPMPEEAKYQLEYTMLRKNKYYYTIYIIALNFVFNGLLPFVLIIAMNALLYNELKVRAKNQPYMPNTGSAAIYDARDQRLIKHSVDHTSANKRIKHSEVIMSKVTVIIAFVLVIFHSIKWIPNIYELTERIIYNDEDIEFPMWVEEIIGISHFSIILNSSVNFYIYWATHYKLTVTV